MFSKAEELVDTGEEIQKSVYPSVFDEQYVRGYMITALITAAILGVLAVKNFTGMLEAVPNTVIVGLLVIPGILALKNGIDRRRTIYHFTDKQIIEEEGILSKDYQSIAYSRVQDVQLNEKMSERMFNVGDVLIKTAGSSGAEVILEGLKNPESYERLISKRANQKNDDGGVSTGSSEMGSGQQQSSGSISGGSDGGGIGPKYVENELTRVNNEIQRLNQKSNRQGLSESERERWYKLEGQRELLNRMQEEEESSSGGGFDSDLSTDFSSDL